MSESISAQDSPVDPTVPAPSRHQWFSWSRVAAISSNTFLELVRMKVFYFMLLFALILIGLPLLWAKLTFQEQFEMLKDVTLGAMSIFTFLLAVLTTAFLLPKDVEDRTLYTILAKPVPRFEYLLGKLLGVLTMLAVATLFMTVAFIAVLYIQQQRVLAETIRTTAPADLEVALRRVHEATFNVNLVAAIVALYLKAALIASLTLMLSTFSTSWVFTILSAFMIVLIGYMQSTARYQWLDLGEGGPLAKMFLMGVSLLFPDLQLFSLVDDIAAGAIVPAMLFVKIVGMGVAYTGIYLLAGYFVFAGKEL